ncbi:voltage-gated potassium channel [Desulfonauticus submarinus]|uniref:Voltage-gated potassium channel n=1 Tax=Desulfonauticus submarinus TaxID=206665 RepID=A0A1H0EU30_9BACT|nr:potassium channel family protein [Desulfonauticus submarinus]SDN85904.1 voltage-gated potassium channel [Desulfonauticus submarinus]
MKKSLVELFSKTWFKLSLFFVFLLGVSSFLFYLLEPGFTGIKDFFLALWWTVVTVTTVGYGDIVPSTGAGKILGVVVMLTGIGLVSILTGNLASFLMEKRIKKRKGQLEVNLKGHLVILNWNEFGWEILKKTGLPVVIVAPLEEDLFEQIKAETEKEVYYLNGSPKRENFLKKAKLQMAQTAIILSPDKSKITNDPDQEVLYTLLSVRELAPSIPVFVEILEPQNKSHIIRAGADRVLIRGEATSLLLSQVSVSPFIFTFAYKLLTSSGNLLKIKRLSGEERKMSWKEFKENNREIVPLALCKERATISLSQVLDDNSNLDKFIQEIFDACGVDDTVSSLEPEVVLNPELETSLASFDAVIYMSYV